MRRVRSRAVQPTDAVPFDPNQPTPGDFRPDGSWNPEGSPPEEHNPERHLYWFVDMLVTKRRRDPGCEPYRFASRINRSPFVRAFPNAMDISPRNLIRWCSEVNRVPIPWYAVATSTAAESAVKYAGYGAVEGSIDKILALHAAEVRARPDLPVNRDLVGSLAESREKAGLPAGLGPAQSGDVGEVNGP